MTRVAHMLLAAALLAACRTNPITERRQLMLISEEEEVQLGAQAYQQVLAEEPVTTDPRLTAPLVRVGQAIAEAAEAQWSPGYAWEFKLVARDDVLNAFALPGGKIAFYTGIYPVLRDEAGMAIVMGHEVMHAILRHGGERVSQNLLTQLGLTGAQVALGFTDLAPEHQQLAMAAMGVTAQIGILLPYSREHETEADKHGLFLAARAGYDPEAAIAVWERMAEAGGAGVPEFLSTHPDPLRRVENMRAWMPEARRLYEQSQKKQNRPLPSIR